MRFLRHPRTGRPDMMTTLSTIAVAAAAIKFLLDGQYIQLGGSGITFAHVDPLAYSSFLAPILGAHSWLDSKNKDRPVKVDNPDAT